MGSQLAVVASVALATLAVLSLYVCRGLVAEAWRKGSRAQALAAQVLVSGGMLSATVFVGNRAVIQVVTVGAFISILLFAESREFSRMSLVGNRTKTIEFNSTPVTFPLLLWLWLFSVNLWAMAAEDRGDAIFRIISGVSLVFFLINQRYRPITGLHFFSAALITISIAVVPAPFWGKAFVECGKFKCNDLGAILQGPFPSGNLLGLAAAICGALLLIIKEVSRREVVTLVFLVAILYATMSRTSLFALGAASALAILDKMARRKRDAQKGHDTLDNLTAFFVAFVPVLGVVLVYISAKDAFSNRGRIWGLGREAMEGSEIAGRGLDWWGVLLERGHFGLGFDHGQHSEYLLLYFSGGIVALTLFGCALFQLTSLGIRVQGSLARGAVVPVTFAVSGIFENVWNPLTVDQSTWLFYALVSVCVKPLSNRLQFDRASPAKHSSLRRDSWTMVDRCSRRETSDWTER